MGIRELCRDQADLLILAGPTLDIDGPMIIYRWKEALQEKQESFVYGEALQKVVEIQPDQNATLGKDRAEGLTLLPIDGNGQRSVLVVYDSTSGPRQVGDSSLLADIFTLP